MKKLLPADIPANKITFWHLLLLLGSLPFNSFYSHLILISLAVHVLIHFSKEKVKKVITLKILSIQSIFFLTLITYIYSINKTSAANEIVLYLPMLFLPVIFEISGFNFKKYRQPLLMGFSIICSFTIIYLFWDALHTIRFYKMPLSQLFSAAFTNHNFSEPIGMHATFFSMQLVIAFVYLLTMLVGKRSNATKILCGICSVILLAGLFQLCSKSVLFTVFIVVSIAFPLFLLRGKSRLKFTITIWALALIAGLGLFKVSAFRGRYFSELKADLSKPVAGESIDPRRARWDVAMQLIKASPIIGYGAGSETGLLHEEFYKRRYYSSFVNNLNAHNQYLSFLLQSGILGLIIYLAILVFGFRLAIKNKDLLFFTFMLLLAVVSVSEDYLSVDKGVFFYAVFFSFFIFSGEGVAKLPVKQTDKFITAGNQAETQTVIIV